MKFLSFGVRLSPHEPNSAAETRRKQKASQCEALSSAHLQAVLKGAPTPARPAAHSTYAISICTRTVAGPTRSHAAPDAVSQVSTRTAWTSVMSSPFALITGEVLVLERREDWRGASLPRPRERWADGGEGSAAARSPECQPTGDRLDLGLGLDLDSLLCDATPSTVGVMDEGFFGPGEGTTTATPTPEGASLRTLDLKNVHFDLDAVGDAVDELASNPDPSPTLSLTLALALTLTLTLTRSRT